MDDLHGDTAKIDAASIKECERDGDDADTSNVLESIFSTRLDEQVYGGLINFMNVLFQRTADDDIEKALVSHFWS